MATVKKTGSLTVEHIIKEDAQLDKLQKVVFEDGRYTEVFKKFRSTKISKMLEDYFIFLADYESMKANAGEEINQIDLMDFLNLFIVLHFSTLVTDIPKNLAEKIHIFEKIIDNELIEHIFAAFDLKEIDKVYTHFFRKIESYQKLIENNAELKLKFNEHINNKRRREDN